MRLDHSNIYTYIATVLKIVHRNEETYMYMNHCLSIQWRYIFFFFFVSRVKIHTRVYFCKKKKKIILMKLHL